MTAIDHLTGRLLNRHSGLIPKGLKPQAHGEGSGPL
jgi:hypothetical protein